MTIHCDQFDDRLNDCLDQRRSIDDDSELTLHAAQCDDCERKILAWVKIQSVVAAPITETGRRSRYEDILPGAKHQSSRQWLAIAAIAIASLTVLASYRATRLETVAADSTLINDNSVAISQIDSIADLDPITWWHGVQQNDWVGQTMPAVRSFGEGVAPLGRSLMRAVTILTTGGPDQTS